MSTAPGKFSQATHLSAAAGEAAQDTKQWSLFEDVQITRNLGGRQMHVPQIFFCVGGLWFHLFPMLCFFWCVWALDVVLDGFPLVLCFCACLRSHFRDFSGVCFGFQRARQ